MEWEALVLTRQVYLHVQCYRIMARMELRKKGHLLYQYSASVPSLVDKANQGKGVNRRVVTLCISDTSSAVAKFFVR